MVFGFACYKIPSTRFWVRLRGRTTAEPGSGIGIIVLPVAGVILGVIFRVAHQFIRDGLCFRIERGSSNVGLRSTIKNDSSTNVGLCSSIADGFSNVGIEHLVQECIGNVILVDSRHVCIVHTRIEVILNRIVRITEHDLCVLYYSRMLVLPELVKRVCLQFGFRIERFDLGHRIEFVVQNARIPFRISGKVKVWERFPFFICEGANFQAR